MAMRFFYTHGPLLLRLDLASWWNGHADTFLFMPTAPAQSEPMPPVPTASVNGAATFISTPASASAVSTIIPVSSIPEEDNAPTPTGTPPGKVFGAVPSGSSLSIGPVSTSFGVVTVPTTIVTEAPGTDARGSSIRTRTTITTSTEITTTALVTPSALVPIADLSNKPNVGAISGAVLAALVLIALGISTIMFLRRRRHRLSKRLEEQGPIEEFAQRDVEDARLIAGAQTIIYRDEKRDIMIAMPREETRPALDPFADPRTSYSASSVNASTAPPPYLSREPSLAGSL
ncbi:hypothetical protein EXIGLDRAFT_841117 [Exidia glandulosa HHB12029]|uniref:Uncharacterized protein n=1 Tax=Exidia glandulosa HHB12029 TaxID=1314781 RepID=A0A165E2T0_EXIGL|nr:hypothetical protein EXIGLDRAFT_841117 [Exidia glandulosa HHB12029]